MSAKLVLLAGATILSLVANPAGVSEAPPQSPAGDPSAQRGARIYGVVQQVTGDPLTLATPAGQVSLITDTNTRFHIPGAERPELGDFGTGDVVAAAGWWEDSGGAFHAFILTRLQDDRAFPVVGQLLGLGEEALVIETPHGAATVRLDNSTTYRIGGSNDSGLDDLEVGMSILARGTLNSDGSLQAQVVAARAGSHQGRLRGTLTAIDEDTFTIQTARQRRIEVLTGGETHFRVPGVDHPTIGDLNVGDHIAGQGTIEQDGTVRATLVIVLPQQAARLAGQVASITGSTIVLDTDGGQVEVLTDDETILSIPGVDGADLDDIAAGHRIVAGGTWESKTTFHAISVVVRRERDEGQPGTVRGRVIDTAGTGVVLGTVHGPVDVLADDQTQIRVPGIEHADHEDIETGAWVVARGVWTADGSLEATGLAVLRAHRGRNAPSDQP